MRKWILITPHQGLGDHLLCLGMYREFAASNRRVFITVKSIYYKELKAMLSDLQNVTFLRLPMHEPSLWRTTRILQKVAYRLGIRVIGLGGFGHNFLKSKLRYDENFYLQADIEFHKRWSSFFVPRNANKENELFTLLGCDEKPYIFLHEDAARNFRVNRDYLPKNIRIIEPSADRKIFNLIDYRKIIEEAQEIHTIESSFGAFIESLNLDKSLNAHRYSRPEANQDPRLEFSYKSAWRIYYS
jgi:hypothetical protein